MRTISMGGKQVPAVGLGTWRMGEDPSLRQTEADALRLGFDLGMTLVDTAEMYAEGGAEEVVGIAIQGRRDEVFVVSKVLPDNASRRETVVAAERSLKRLGTDRIDLYLLHWPSRHPLQETLAAFRELQSAGKIRHYGVSNFDRDAMEAAFALPGGNAITANQVLYNVSRRSVESRLLPWSQEHSVAIMAYSPLDQGRLRPRKALAQVAARHDVTPEQIALAFTIRHEGVMTIPKAGKTEHVHAAARAAEVVLSSEDLRDLEAEYPAPHPNAPLETL